MGWPDGGPRLKPTCGPCPIFLLSRTPRLEIELAVPAMGGVKFGEMKGGWCHCPRAIGKGFPREIWRVDGVPSNADWGWEVAPLGARAPCKALRCDRETETG
eukprot:1393868-Amorphochlora_amoeboformis.AAC.3